ncbi:MAG TPA: hypothetical protein VFO44_01775 [Steroidobacteraceae bacterium]|nr:hypothetical protein [Steroidobacteraceae bacterium]
MYSTELPDRFIVGGTALRYESSAGESWELIAEQILCIGEATAESGPRGESWHLCFVTDPHGNWLEGSLEAEGRNDALHWLSVRLGCSLELKLANGPAFRSRVMWPMNLLEAPLFHYQIPTWRRLFSRSLRRIGLAPVTAVQSVRPDIVKTLWRASHRPASRSA